MTTQSQSVTFPHGPIAMAGNLFTPEGFTESQQYAGIVVVHPGGGVKEQTAGIYAEKLAGLGYVALAYDASHQGESGGEPHFLEDPSSRVRDIIAAVDYLQSLDFVDAERIGVWGICAGGGYGATATMLDKRIKAFGASSALNIGTSWRQGWDGSGSVTDANPALDGVAQQRTAEKAQGAETAEAQYVPVDVTDEVPRDLAEAHEYYLTTRAQHPRAENRYLMTESIPRIMGYDAFHLAEDLFTAPLLLVAGADAGSLWHSTQLHGMVRSEKKLVVVEGAAHMDFYDVPEYVDRAVAEAKPFFAKHLGA